MELENVDAGVPTLACHDPFDAEPPFSIDDPKGDSEGSRPGVYTKEENSLGCDG